MIDWTWWGIFKLAGMPHWVCVGSAWVAIGLVANEIIIGTGYFRFWWINRQIRRKQAENKYWVTDNTYKGFQRVFIYCGLKSYVTAVSMFTPVAYLPLLIIKTLNSRWIWKTNFWFYRAMPALSAHSMPRAKAKEEQDLLINSFITACKSDREIIFRLYQRLKGEEMEAKLNRLEEIAKYGGDD